MPRPRTSDTASAQRDRLHYQRRKAGLVVVPVVVHQTRREEIEAIAAQMQKPVDAGEEIV